MIDLTANVQVAMLMAIVIEVKAIRPGTKCIDFIRALIGIGVLKSIAMIKKNKKYVRWNEKKLKTLKETKTCFFKSSRSIYNGRDKDKIGKKSTKQ